MMDFLKINVLVFVLIMFSSCTDKCQREPLSKEELATLFDLLSNDEDLSSLFTPKEYPSESRSTNSIQISDGQIFELIQDPKYDLDLFDTNDDCSGEFQILRVNRKTEESPVGESIVLVYNSLDAFKAQRDIIMDLDNFTVGMGSMDLFGRNNANYLQPRTGIKFYSLSFDVKQVLMLRRFEKEMDRIQIETFWTELDDDTANKIYFIVIRVYPKDERWSY